MAASRDAPPDRAATRGAVGLADLLNVLAGLDIGHAAHAVTAARCLGFTGIDLNPAASAGGAADQRHRHPRPPAGTGRAGAPAYSPPPVPRRTPPPAPPPARVRESVLETLDPRGVETPPEPTPDWFAAARLAAQRAPAPPAQDARRATTTPAAERTSAAPVRAPLLPRRTASAVLRAAVATRRPGAEPDIGRILDALLAGELQTPLPMLPEAALHRGVQLLLDVSEPMTPWFADLRELARQLSAFVGAALCEVYQFTGHPAGAERAPGHPARHRRWSALRARPVLIASSLGLGAGPALHVPIAPAQWLRFAARLRKAGAPLVCLTPVGPERWPAAFGRHLTLVHWDPATRAETVRRLLGAGHAVID